MSRSREQAKREARISKYRHSDSNNGGGNSGGDGLTMPPYTIESGGTGPRGPYSSGIIPGMPPVSTIPTPPAAQALPGELTTPTRWANNRDGSTTTGDKLMPKEAGGKPDSGLTEAPYQVEKGGTGPWGPGASGVIPGLPVVPTIPLPPPPRYNPSEVYSMERKASAPNGELKTGDALIPKPKND